MSGRARAGALRRAETERGQTLVEFAYLVPLFLLLLLAMLEFGFAFTHNLTLEYATREGARTGAALANGDNASVDCLEVDRYVIAAVERVLVSPGSQINLARVSEVRIYESTATGAVSGMLVNDWTYDASPDSEIVVDGDGLMFDKDPFPGYSCTQRNNGVNPDSIGVSLTYTYDFVTPLAGILKIVGGGATPSLTMSDKTVMQLNPTN